MKEDEWRRRGLCDEANNSLKFMAGNKLKQVGNRQGIEVKILCICTETAHKTQWKPKKESSASKRHFYMTPMAWLGFHIHWRLTAPDIDTFVFSPTFMQTMVFATRNRIFFRENFVAEWNLQYSDRQTADACELHLFVQRMTPFSLFRTNHVFFLAKICDGCLKDPLF